MPTLPQIHRPGSVEEAVRLLEELSGAGEVIGGGTWIMRAQLRGEATRPTYVSLQDVPEATRLDQGDPTRIGAGVTHAQLAVLDDQSGPLGAIRDAARMAAFWQIRNVATIAGNICVPVPEVDLVAALLACDAAVETVSAAGAESVPLASYLSQRGKRPPSEVIGAFVVPAPAGRRSAFERLIVRGGGEFPLASVAISVDLDDSGGIADARVAVGAVEETARRLEGAEAALRERGLDLAASADVARAAQTELTGRDAVDAPGWYRVAVIPALVHRVLTRLAQRT